MDVPADAFGVLALVVLVLPGIVWVAVRTAVRGRRPNDADVAGRVLQALLISVTVDASYALCLGPTTVKRIRTVRDLDAAGTRTAAGAVLVLGVAIPALLAHLVHGQVALVGVLRRPVEEWPRGLRWLRRLCGSDWLHLLRSESTQRSIPTAWDSAAPGLGGRWIRIRTADGKWVAGWYANGSYVSTYPEPRDIYVEDQHSVDKDGTIGGPVPNSAGFWMALRDGDIVEWIDPQYVDLPPVNLPEFPVAPDAPMAEVAEAARATRAHFGMAAGPVSHVVRLLEAHGVLVLRLRTTASTHASTRSPPAPRPDPSSCCHP